MKKQELYDEVYTILGDSMVDIELSEKDIDVAFNRAKRRYKQYADNNWIKGYYCVHVTKGKQEYFIPSDVHTVVKIIRPELNRTMDADYGYVDNNNYHQYRYTNANSFLTLELVQQNLEIWRQYMAHDIDFEYNQQMGIIRFLNMPIKDEEWVVECYMDMSDEQYMDVSWIIDWTIAESKKILGSAYRKFSGVPSPDGSSVQLNGGQIIQEAEQDMQRLTEDIQNGLSGDTEWWGVIVG